MALSEFINWCDTEDFLPSVQEVRMDKRCFSIFGLVIIFSLGFDLFGSGGYCQDGLGVFKDRNKPSQQDGLGVFKGRNKPSQQDGLGIFKDRAKPSREAKPQNLGRPSQQDTASSEPITGGVFDGNTPPEHGVKSDTFDPDKPDKKPSWTSGEEPSDGKTTIFTSGQAALDFGPLGPPAPSFSMPNFSNSGFQGTVALAYKEAQTFSPNFERLKIYRDRDSGVSGKILRHTGFRRKNTFVTGGFFLVSEMGNSVSVRGEREGVGQVWIQYDIDGINESGEELNGSGNVSWLVLLGKKALETYTGQLYAVTLHEAAESLLSNNPQIFKQSLSKNLQNAAEENVAISENQANQLGSAMKSARLIYSSDYYAFYEMTIDETVYPLTLVKEEDGKWKIDQF